MKYHLGNLAYTNCKKACMMVEGQVTDQLHFNQHKLVIIDSLIKQKDLRDNLFRSVAVDYLLKHDSEENINTFIDELHQLSANNKHIEEIDSLYEGIRRMQPNNELPDLTVYNTDGDEVSLKEIASNKEVVFYFWSGIEPSHFRKITQHIAKLRLKHPEYTFVGINLRTDNSRWKSLLESSDLNKGEQYWCDNFDEIAHTLIVYDPNKSIIAKDGVIVNAFANVYSSF
jgi:peroxiredoxin